MGLIAEVLTASLPIAALADKLIGGGFVARRDAAGPRSELLEGDTFTTGDIVWNVSTQDYYDPQVWAYNTSGNEVEIVIVKPARQPGEMSPSVPLSVPAYYAIDVTAPLKVFDGGCLTMATQSPALLAGGGADFVPGNIRKALCVSIPALVLGVGAAVVDGVSFSITGDAQKSQITFKVARPTFTGEFSATVTNKGFSATVTGSLNKGSGSSGAAEFEETDLVFELPPFLEVGATSNEVAVDVLLMVPPEEVTFAEVRAVRGRPAAVAARA
jgi:hypothetical protein